MKEVNGIPRHKSWTEIRDERGGKSNMCKKANIGKLLDAYWDTGAKVAERKQALDALLKGLLAYNAEKAVKENKELFKATLKIQGYVDQELTLLNATKDVGLAVGLDVVKGLKFCQSLATTPDSNIYGKLYDGAGRGLGKTLPSAGTLAPLREYWVQVHSSVPTRQEVDNEKDKGAQDNLIKDGTAKYKTGLVELVTKAKDLGLTIKLH